MTTESKCPKCGTMLHGAMKMIEVSTGEGHWQNRCNEVLHAQLTESRFVASDRDARLTVYENETIPALEAKLTEVTRQRDEAIRALDASADMLDYVAPRSAMTGVDDALLLSVRHAARAALEVLRGKL